MLSQKQIDAIRLEFQRLNFPSHEDGRIWTFQSAELSGAEMLARLRGLPDGAGKDAVLEVLGKGPRPEPGSSSE